MSTPTEILSTKGDLWTVRKCKEPGCVVLSHTLNCNQMSANEMRAVLDRNGVDVPAEAFGEPDEQEPDELHIPADVLVEVIRALSRLGRQR